MRFNIVFLKVFVAALALAGAASANPEGAPWGSANPAAVQNCASCHFDYEAAADSELLSLDGLPAKVSGGVRYELTLSLAASDATVAGFMLAVSAGSFAVNGGERIEAKHAEARSTAPIAAGKGAEWRIMWIAPEGLSGEVIFHAAINGANDDASPFGDIVHFRTFKAKAAN